MKWVSTGGLVGSFPEAKVIYILQVYLWKAVFGFLINR